MAIDAEDILVCLWRFLRFFINTSQVFAQKFPFVSCMLLLSFFVYLFFNLLLYHLPFLIFVAFLLRFFWSSEPQPETRNDTEQVRNDRDKLENHRNRTIPRPVKDGNAVVARSREISSLIRQKSRRTHFGKNRSFVAPAAARASKEENDTKLVVVQEERETLISFEHGQSSNADVDKTQSHDVTNDNSPGSETSRPDCVSDEYEDEEEEEEEEEDRRAKSNEKNKAVEWSEDDQRNVVDLGISEMERNRRLESLMAKRRARKLPKLPGHSAPLAGFDVPKSSAATSTAVGDHTTSLMAPIFVARNALNPFDDNSTNSSGGNELEGLEVPGSAPSVLLPAKNPFDIPYDPTEEKPDLMADSFQEEFAAVNQKETMIFCRHESFFLGPSHQFCSDIGQDRRDNAYFSSFLGAEKPGDDDRLIEQLLGDTKSHIDHTPSQLVVESGSQCLTQVLDSETSKPERETDTTTNDRVSEQDVLNDMENESNLDAVSTITEVDTEPPLLEDSETTSSSSFEVPNRAVEASNSLEPGQDYGHEDKSDMLTCSIPTTIEPRYDSSPTASERSKSIGTDDGFFFRDKLSIHTPSCSIASDLQVEVSEVGSPPLTHGNVSPADGDSLSFDEEMEQPQLLNFGIEPFDGTNQAKDVVGMSRDSGSSDTLVNQEMTTMQLAEKFASHPFFEAVYEKIEALSPRDEPAEEYAGDEAARDSVTDSNTVEDTQEQEKHKGEEILIGGDIINNLTAPSEETELGSSTQFEHQSLGFSQPITGDGHEGKSEEERITEASRSIEAEGKLINTIEERKDEQNSVESEASFLDQNAGAIIDSAGQEESLVEVVPVNQSSPSSPMSTPVERTALDEVFSSNLDEDQIQMDIPIISPEVEHVVKSSLLGEPPLYDHSSLTRPQNGEDLAADLSNPTSNTGDFETFQEPSETEKISDETNIIFDSNSPVSHNKSGTGEFESNKSAEVEVPETPADIENALETLAEVAEELGNPRSKVSE